MKPAEAAKAASRMLGSQAEMARRLRVKAPTVNQWCSGERPIPAKRALQIEALTGGEIGRAELCPDLPWTPKEGADVPPTLMQMMPLISTSDQSGNCSVNPSSNHLPA